MAKFLDRLRSDPKLPRKNELLRPRRLFTYTNNQVEEFCRERVAPVYVGDGQVLSRYLSCYKIITDSKDEGFAPHIIMDGYWELWLTRWMVETVQPGWTALDVGANYGYYSVLLADLVGEHGRLLAFEPNPVCAKAVKFSLAINGFASRSRLHEVALSNTTGSCDFVVPPNEPKNGHLVLRQQEKARLAKEQITGQFTVPTDTLDNIAEPLERLDFIKIDAEGAEFAIFEGMQATIARHNPLIMMEFNAGRGDVDGFVEQLRTMYPDAQYLDSHKGVCQLRHDQLKEEKVGQDWLLILKQ